MANSASTRKELIESNRELVKQKEQFIQVGSQRFMTSNIKVKSFQRDLLIKLKTIVDGLIKESKETGELPKDFNSTVKNLVALTDKMRRQDEGIKFETDIRHSHDEFREIINISAKKIAETDHRYGEKFINLNDK